MMANQGRPMRFIAVLLYCFCLFICAFIPMVDKCPLAYSSSETFSNIV